MVPVLRPALRGAGRIDPFTHRSEEGRALAVLAGAHAAEIGDMGGERRAPGEPLAHVSGHQRLDRDALPDVETEGTT